MGSFCHHSPPPSWRFLSKKSVQVGRTLAVYRSACNCKILFPPMDGVKEIINYKFLSIRNAVLTPKTVNKWGWKGIYIFIILAIFIIQKNSNFANKSDNNNKNTNNSYFNNNIYNNNNYRNKMEKSSRLDKSNVAQRRYLQENQPPKN